MSGASISGFTFIRNGVMLGFPFVESIRSLLPLVDEFVVAVGRGEDATLERVKAIGDGKIRIIETVWNERMADRGFVYAQQKMMAQYACTGDWAFYLEGDEVVHEDELDTIRASVQRHHGNPAVEALVAELESRFNDGLPFTPVFRMPAGRPGRPAEVTLGVQATGLDE